MTYRRCSVIGENGLQCKNVTYVGDRCFTHARRARKDTENLPAYGGGVLGKHEARTRTDATPTQTSLSLDPLTRTEPSDGYVEWHDRDDDEHIDPLDRIEDMAHDYRKSRRG